MGGVCVIGDRLKLREFEPTDEEALHAIVGDPVVTAYTLWGPNQPADTRAFLAKAKAQADMPEARVGYHLALVDRDQKLAGSVVLDLESAAHGRGVVGFVVAPWHWGLGYGHEALGLILDFAFGRLGLHRVTAHCHPEHRAGVRVLEKAGMRLEGTLSGYKQVRGEWVDSLLYARVGG
jgi:[ribosomal protein S5]-alanine N-acetyltransferase